MARPIRKDALTRVIPEVLASHFSGSEVHVLRVLAPAGRDSAGRERRASATPARHTGPENRRDWIEHRPRGVVWLRVL